MANAGCPIFGCASFRSTMRAAPRPARVVCRQACQFAHLHPQFRQNRARAVIALHIFIGGFAVRTGKLRFGWVLATALSASAFSTSASAYTPEQQQACTGDAMNLCGAYIPDVDRITACMIQNKSRLSPGCRAHFRAGPEPAAAAARPAGRPVSLTPTAPRKAAKAKKPRKRQACQHLKGNGLPPARRNRGKGEARAISRPPMRDRLTPCGGASHPHLPVDMRRGL